MFHARYLGRRGQKEAQVDGKVVLSGQGDTQCLPQVAETISAGVFI